MTSASTRSRAAVWARGRFFKREHKLETINATSNPTHRYGPWTPQIISHTPTPKPTLYCWFLFASDTLLEFHFSPSFLACNISIPIPHRFPPFTSPLSPSPPSPLSPHRTAVLQYLHSTQSLSSPPALRHDYHTLNMTFTKACCLHCHSCNRWLSLQNRAVIRRDAIETIRRYILGSSDLASILMSMTRGTWVKMETNGLGKA